MGLKGGLCRLPQGMKSCTIAKIPYIFGLNSFIGLAIMIFTGMASIAAIWELLKRCLLCM